MIKVNLLRNLSGTAVAAPGTFSGAMPMGGGVTASQDVQKQALARLAVIAGAVLLVIFYEKTELSAKQQLVTEKQSELSRVKAEIAKFGDAAPMVEKYNQEKEKLDRQISVLEGLTANRLREVKLLDAIQSIMPQKAWLDQLEVVQGKGRMTGYADTDDTANMIYQQLQANVLFKLDAPTSRPERDPDLGEIKKFEIPFVTGKSQ